MKPILSCFLKDDLVWSPASFVEHDHNRSFLFGDGVFETMRVRSGKIIWPDLHFDRLTRSLQTIGIQTQVIPEASLLEELIIRLPKPFPVQLRLKLLVFRNSGGAYKPDSDEAACFVQVFPMEATQANGETSMRVGIYHAQKKTAGALSWMKSTSAHLYVAASRAAAQNGWDDCLILNERDELIEGSSSNLFVFMDGQWHTPPLDSGCIEGVYRRKLMEVAEKKGNPILEKAFRFDDLMAADELILTNAISGIRWIGRLEGKTFGCKEAGKLYDEVHSIG